MRGKKKKKQDLSVSAASWEWLHFLVTCFADNFGSFHYWRKQWPAELLWMPYRFRAPSVPPHRYLHLLIQATWSSPHSFPSPVAKPRIWTCSHSSSLQLSKCKAPAQILVVISHSMCTLSTPHLAVHLHVIGLTPNTKPHVLTYGNIFQPKKNVWW